VWSGACFANECEGEPPRRLRFVQLDSGAADDRHARSPVPCRSQRRHARPTVIGAHTTIRQPRLQNARRSLVGGSEVRPA